MKIWQFKKILSANWCFIGIIFFFVLHGYSENQFLVPINQLIWLLIEVLITSIAVFAISRLIFRDNRKANIFTSFAFIVILFFGAFQDFLSEFSFLSFFTRLIVFLPVTLLMIVLFFIWLKKTKRPLNGLVSFLNILLLIYLLVDIGTITTRALFKAKMHDRSLEKYGLVNCKNCNKPSVYLIILDTYFGSKGLKEYFHYDNSGFENFLTQQGFHVSEGTHSNYIFTLYSMGSMLSMNYLNVKDPVITNHYGYYKATEALRNNIVCRFFKSQGYIINNFSIFDVPGVPAGYNSGLLPDKIQLITNQTMYYRVIKYLPSFLTRQNLVKRSEGFGNSFSVNNEKMMQRTLDEALVKKNAPVFTYLHLMLPHYPYLFDSLGNRQKPATFETRDQAFLQYEVYANKRISTFITQLKKETGGNAVILLMSDHGLQYTWSVYKKMGYYNLNAVYLPQKNYNGWYNGMSNVNQFRVLFNNLFHQSLPMLRDSICY